MLISDLTRASSLARLDEFCAKYGLDHLEMLRQAELPLDILENPESLISYTRLTRLLENCATEAHHPLFALEYGVFQGTAVFGNMLYLLKNADTVGESLQELIHYFYLHSNSGRVTMSNEGGMCILSYEPILPDYVSQRHASELAIGVGKSLLKMLLGSRWKANGVHFQHAAASSPLAYKRILGVSPQFNSTTNGLVLESKQLNLRLSDSDPQLHMLMREHLEKLEGLTAQELPSYVQSLIKHLLPQGRVTIEHIADHMIISPRSLQRYLTQEGTSFQKLLNKSRQELAQRYLRESSISLTQLADILGYGDLAAFSRAFQRWYGISPREWRKREGISNSAPLLTQRRKSPSWLN